MDDLEIRKERALMEIYSRLKTLETNLDELEPICKKQLSLASNFDMEHTDTYLELMEPISDKLMHLRIVISNGKEAVKNYQRLTSDHTGSNNYNNKVISVRVDPTLEKRMNTVADRLYAKSYTGQPNRSQLLLDAIRIFCELAEMGKFDDVNMQSVSVDQIISPLELESEDHSELLQAMKQELLPEIEQLIIKHQNS